MTVGACEAVQYADKNERIDSREGIRKVMMVGTGV